MATTQVEFTGDGNATKTFSFPSIQQSDIKVTVDGVLKTSGTHYNITPYTTTGGGSVVFIDNSGSGGANHIPQNTTPATLIRIFRDTDVENPKADFTAGSSVKAEDLNANHQQLLFHAQEEQDQLEQTGNIRDNAIVTSKILDDNVTMAKLGSGSLPTDITVASANIVDGTIVNADINASAAIAGTKVSPNFGTQVISTTGNITVGGTVDGRDVAADGSKLDGIEAGATGDQTASEIKALIGNASDSNVFSDALLAKLNNIEASATTDQTDAEIRAAVEAANDSNVFTDADHSKLNAIEAGATADQTASEIKTLYESNGDTNEFSDAEQTKLAGIESNATQDQTAAEIKVSLQSDKLTLSEINTTSTDTRYYTESELDAGQLDNRYYTEVELLNGGAIDNRYYTKGQLDGGQLNSLYFTETELTNGAVDGRYYTETELDAGQLDNRYYTETELNNGQLDNRYYTETEAEALFLRQDSSETIASGVSWSNSDTKVATTAAINARIVDLIDDVGGFIAIANQTSFPTSNPQGSAGQAAILSIGSATATLTPSGTTVTIANGAGSGNTVTITGVPSTIPTGFGFLVESTNTLHTYSFHRLVPKATEVTTVASNVVNISAAGANVTSIDNFADRYQISASAPTARPDNASLVNGDLWFDSSSNKVMMVYDSSSGDGFSPITPNASDLTNINIVAGQITFSEDLGLITNAVNTGSGNNSVNTVASNITNVNTAATNIAKITTVADDLNEGTSEIDTVATNIANVNTVGNNISNVNTVAGVSSNVTTVAGISSNVTTVAGKATEIGRLGTADAVADMNTLGTTAIVSDLDTLADISSDISTVAGVSSNVTTVSGIASNVTTVAGISANVTTVANNNSNVTAVANNSSNINSAVANAPNINAAVSNSSNINSAASNATNINTVAANITNIDTFANRYRIASSAPTTGLDQGDLYFDTTSNELRVYNGSAWQGGVTATGNLPSNGANTFTGDQTVNANIIVSGTVDGRDVATDGSKLDGIESGATADQSNSEIKTAYEANSNTNAFTDALLSKLNAIETAATADQTASEIVSLISGQTIAPNVITTTNLTLDFGSIA
tara:strand:+ start:737 stop:4003 length:3267 start_codon:yes stop_codon:yes gene_type:complete